MTYAEKIAEKLATVAEGQQAVYDKGCADGSKSEYDRFWDTFQENGKKESYRYAFAGNGWTEETLKPKYKIVIKDQTTAARRAYGMFTYLNHYSQTPFDMTEICKMIDLSEALSTSSVFQNAFVRNITVDVRKSTNISTMFSCNDSGDIDNITLTVSEACTNMTNAFAYCGMLTTLTFTNESVIAANIDLHWSTKLTHESLMSVINCLKDYSGSGSTYTCTLGTENLAKLTDAEKAIATEKGWTLA